MSDSNDTGFPGFFGPLLALLFAGGAITGVLVEGFHVNAIIKWSFLVAFVGFIAVCLLGAALFVLVGLSAFIWEVAIKPVCLGLGWLYRLVTD